MSDGVPAKKSDLGVRTLSAIVMVAAAGTALWIGGYYWMVFVALVSIICLGEGLRLIFKATPSVLIRVLGSISLFIYVFLPSYLLVSYRHSWLHDTSAHIPSIMGFLWVLFPLGSVVFTDIGAYFFGRSIGGPKIAPNISPSKTWAGLFGGMAAASIWGIIWLQLWGNTTGYLFENLPLSLVKVACICSSMAVAAQIGDFFESGLKRKAAVKDSSNLIPGHGGVFDRVDGLLPLVLIFEIFLALDIRPY
jgi:phosphatidate cytidylyltransferase